MRESPRSPVGLTSKNGPETSIILGTWHILEMHQARPVKARGNCTTFSLYSDFRGQKTENYVSMAAAPCFVFTQQVIQVLVHK